MGYLRDETIDELRECLEECAEQLRLFLELHDDDEDGPAVYERAQDLLTRIGRGEG